jgi:hypothetical protein
VWRIKKTSAREFELEQPLRIPHNIFSPQASGQAHSGLEPIAIAVCGGYSLASKLTHTESGGAKLPLAVYRELSAKTSRMSRRFLAAKQRQSMTISSSEQLDAHARSRRIGSEDSGATAIPIGSHSGSRSTAPQLSISMPPRSSFWSPTSPADDAIHAHAVTPKDQRSRSRRDKEKEKEKEKDKERDWDEEKHKKGTLGGVLKRGLFRAQSLVKEYEERTKERGQHLGTNGHGQGHGHSNLAPSSAHAPASGGSSRHSSARPVGSDRPSDPSDTASASSQQSSSGKYESADELADWPEDVTFGSLGLGIEDEQNGGREWTPGKAWEGVPDEALAMVIPLESDSHTPPMVHTPGAPRPFINPFFLDGPRQALLVWFTPFNANSSTAPPDSRSGGSSLFQIAEAPHHEEHAAAHGAHGSHGLSHGGGSGAGNPLRLPKLLRSRTQKHQDGLLASPLSGSKGSISPLTTPPSDGDMQPIFDSDRREARGAQPLPFKSFRVVAKVVDTEDLRSEPEVPVIAVEQWTEQMRTGKPADLNTPPLEGVASGSTVRLDDDPMGLAGLAGGPPVLFSEPSPSPSLTEPSISSGRAFPTVIAVCHSHAAGVEFVLEGLDRLGLCVGGNAWGPTGYEEWRGTGLSEDGRRALDLLWSACSAVMGI